MRVGDGLPRARGEDTLLNARMGAAMVRGFQGEDLSHPEHIAACAKHYVGYGAAEGGRDYNSTWIPENLLRDVYLPSFHACVQAGVATVMSAFNNLNGVPASGNCLTLRQILKGEWAFNGFVVSDWDSIAEMIAHGYCAGRREAALAGIGAGVDMEMVSTCYAEYAQMLIDEGVLAISTIDETVSRILDVKLRLGLFEHPYVEEDRLSVLVSVPHLDTARRLATESCVLLKNDGVLPLAPEIKSLAVIGPLADAPAEQLGCWVADGMPEDSITPLRALHQVLAGRCSVAYAAGLPDARSTDQQGFAEAVSVAASCDAVVLFLGEDAALSGEAHSRAFIDLPGAQEALVQAISACGKPLVAVIMAGRPLTLSQVLESLPAILYAWHPGIMAGPAIADLLLGKVSPSGKLPVSYPRTVGQMPLYYAQANTGRPTPKEHVAPTGTPLNPIGFTSTYLDVDHRPEFPFGFGLSYTTFSYQTLTLSSSTVSPGESLTVSAIVTNTGNMAADEVVQLYTRDLVGSLVRPVKELKDFTRIHLAAGESRRISFNLHTDQLAFHNVDMQLVTEPGEFQVFVGGDSETVN